ncbi:dihydrofolate reductase [bacterium]|nr:dihydrofolate reductase [bacterium]
MGDVIYYLAMSADGYIATPEGDVSWLLPFQKPDEDYGYAAFYNSVGAIVMGGNSFRQTVSFGGWAYPNKPCFVITTQTIDKPPAPTVFAYNGDLRQLVIGLKARLEEPIWLMGGSQLASSMSRAGLIDTLIITIVPVILGLGLPMMSFSPFRDLTLANYNVYPDGVVQVQYYVQRGVSEGD